MTQKVDLYDRLNRGPAFLFLGQQYLSLETGIDPFLSEIVRKYGTGSEEATAYSQLLGNEASKSVESSLAWMQDRCKRFSAPLWLENVANFAWSGVYTSAIDVIWQEAFKTSWREMEPIFTEENNPLDARSRSNLHCTYLFGSVDQSSLDQRPPLTRREMTRRRQTAISLIRRLPTLITPLGSLLIEGYSFNEDWLPLDDLLVVIDEMQVGQVHLFHANDDFKHSPDIQYLVDAGKITLYEDSLAIFLKRGEDFLEFGNHSDIDLEGHLVGIGGKTKAVPISLWNQINRSAIVVEQAAGVDPAPISPEKRYMEFRSFLARSGTKPIWTAYSRNFAFRRDFEEDLFNLTKSKLAETRLTSEPIILHGQSGIGKTVALGSLAYRIKSEAEYPVLFIERRPIRPNNHDLDAFIEWAENQGANNTLVIWDGMMDFAQYLDTVEYLVSRGRKVVLIGTSYRQRANTRTGNLSPLFVEALSKLNTDEVDRFESFLRNLVPNIGGIKSIVERYGANFFAALYRILPTIQRQLSNAINLEATYSEEKITQYAKNMVKDPTETIYKSPLAYALFQAGFISNMGFSEDKNEIASENLTQIEKLTGLVMVPGQFGMYVPIELLMRSIGYNIPLDIVDVLSKVDIFSWSSDSIGNITIGPRLPLEAELIARNRLGGAKYEIEFVAELICHLVPNETEVQFTIDLIRHIDGDNRYSRYLLSIADALTDLREKRSILNPRLMLQESNLLRESIKKPEDLDSSVSLDSILDRAEDVISQALGLVDENNLNPDLRSQLLVELASTLGSRARNLYGPDPKNAERLYLALKSWLFDARVTRRDNFYPIDVLYWTTQDLIRSDNVSLSTQFDARAELLNIFEMAELEESFTSLPRFQERKQQLGRLIGNDKMSDEAFAKLEEQGSTAGYILKAMQMVGELPRDRKLIQQEIAQVTRAVNFLNDHHSKLTHDGKAMQLLFRYWWLSKVHKPIFWGERQSVPFTNDDWKKCQELLTDILRGDEVYRAPIFRYLLGITLFHLNSFEESERIFYELERDAAMRGRRRILRSYLASTSDGEPRKFSGTVDSIKTGENRGEIYVPEIRQRISFIPSDFRRPDISKGSALNDFHIAFNFIGFIADPVRYLTNSERQNI